MATRELRLVIKAIDQATATMKGIAGSAESMGDGFAEAAREARPLGIALAAAGAAGAALMTTAALTAARVEVLGTVLQTVGENAGYSTSQILGYEESVRELGITTGNARQGLIQMMQAELDLADATNLARIAQDAAVIANLNSSEAYKTLITGIQTGRTVLLKNMGLTVDFAAAYKEMASQLGKTTTELTAQEKMQARLNDVKRASVVIEGAYEAAMETVGKRLTSLPRLYEDAAVAIGEAYLPALEGVVGVQEDLLEGLLDLEPEQQAAIGRFLAVGTGAASAAGGLLLLIPQLAAAAKGMKALNLTILGPVGLVAAGLAAVYMITQLPVPLDAVTEAERTAAEASTMLATELYGIDAAALPVIKVISDLSDGWVSRYSPAILEAQRLTDGWATSLLGTQVTLKGLAKQTDMSVAGMDKMHEGLSRVTEAAMDLNTQLGLLNLSIEGPIKEANEEYTQDLFAIEAQIDANIRALANLDPAHEDYDQAVRDSRGELHNLRMSAAELAVEHKEAINSIIYDMILAQLALDGWTQAELDFALETGRAMGLVDEATYNTGRAIIDAFAEARDQGILPTVDAMLGIRDAALEIPGAASEAGAGLASGMQPGIDALGVGIHTAGQLDAAIRGIERTVHISVYWDHYGERPADVGWDPTGGPQPGPGGITPPPGQPTAGPPAQPPGGPQEFQHGTASVPQTGWAWVHKGEAIIPANQNPGEIGDPVSIVKPGELESWSKPMPTNMWEAMDQLGLLPMRDLTNPEGLGLDQPSKPRKKDDGGCTIIINNYFGADSVRDRQDILDLSDAIVGAEELRGKLGNL